MTDYITYREVREITVLRPLDDYETEDTYGEELQDVKVISREEVSRRHEIDYAWECDLEAGLFYLRADGERIFSSRSHDAVIAHAETLGDDVTGVQLYGDLEDHEKFWRLLEELPAQRAHFVDGVGA